METGASPHDHLFNAKKLYKVSQYLMCVEYIDTHLSQLGSDRTILGNAYCLQAQAYSRLGEYDKAMVCVLRALEVDNKSKHAHYWLGNIYRELGFYKMAEDAYKNAIKLYPQEEYYYLNLASVYKAQNKLDQAIASYQSMLHINPKNTKAYRNMSVCFKYNSIYHEHHEKVLELMLDPTLTDEQKMECYFTLGKIYLDCEQHQKAFCFLQTANLLRSQMVPFNLEAHSKRLEEICKNFDITKAKTSPIYQTGGEQLVFVVGIPRSGKTLIEQILVKTNEVIGLGELAAFERIIRKTNKQLKEKLQSNQDPKQMDKEMTEYMVSEYLKEVKRRSFGENKIVVDTTPTNYQHIGLISKLFPMAKIIHCTRHPLDHILQIYFKYFAEGNGFSYDLIKLTHFYIEYVQLMNFWKENMVMQVLEINYEEIVRHPRPNIQKICEFVNVPTPSSFEGIYHQEVSMWRHYDNYLEIVKAILKKYHIPF